jgi:hypothetical protein
MLLTPLKFTNGVAWHPTGLRVAVDRAGGKDSSRVLNIEDLNPQAKVVHVMSRWDCLRLGLLIIWRSIWAHNPGMR